MADVLLGEGWTVNTQQDPLEIAGFAEQDFLDDRLAEQQAEQVHKDRLVMLLSQIATSITTPEQPAPILPSPALDLTGLAAVISHALSTLPQPPDLTVELAALAKAVEKMDRRVAAGAMGGGGSVMNPDISDRAARLLGTITGPSGVFGYKAVVSGTVALTGGKKVQTVTVHCTTAGSFTINGGDTVIIPANSQFSASFKDGKLTDPTFVFTGSDSAYMDWLA